ncbi:MAG: sigma-54 interaction domain-containing protein [Candidatus Krumholzibacteriia bacterium]
MNRVPADLRSEGNDSGDTPNLQLVSGHSGDPEPLAQGLRAVRELVRASNCVLFSILPHGLVFHAAAGADSARLAQRLGSEAARLDERVLGPCVLGTAGLLRGDSHGLALLESPLPGTVILAERRHREMAWAVALSVRPPYPVVSGATMRFAHAVFRDLTRLLRDRDNAPDARRAVEARWEKCRFVGLVGRSRQMRQLFRTIEKLASSDVNVLVLGESGTGKELVARAIHDSDLYAGRKFVAQNCAALPESLLESELFGHCKGAFTGANYEKRGLFEEANGGTFFLDEIADMPIALQIKMLRVLQDGEIRRLGETRTRQVSVRIIAATNRNLTHEVTQGRFREDLYYRLNVVKLELPPLRRRREDIPLLARYFRDKVSARLARPSAEFSDEVLARFLEYDWPGNVRELENEIERLVALYGDEEVMQPYMLSERLRYGASVDWSLDRLEEIRDLHQATEYLERALIARCLERHTWNKSRTAVELGISRQGLIKKIKRLRLVRPEPAAKQGDADPPSAAQPQLPFEFVEEARVGEEVCAVAAD